MWPPVRVRASAGEPKRSRSASGDRYDFGLMPPVTTPIPFTDEELDAWAGKIAAWRASGHDVYVYFDNDARVHAPYDAMRLAGRVGL